MGTFSRLLAGSSLPALFICFSSAAVTISAEIERFAFDANNGESVVFQFGPQSSLAAMDEFGRTCSLRTGEIVPFERDGEMFWRLQNANGEGAPDCPNGMTFKIQQGQFVRHDHGFVDIFKYYATQACETSPGRKIDGVQAQMLTDCFLKRDKWATVKAARDWYLGVQTSKSIPRREACTKFLLTHEEKTVTCTEGFKKLSDAAAFRDVVVLKEGHHQIRGAGGNASNYVLHPDFQGSVDLAGHGRVFHLPHQACVSPDIFRGCTMAGDPGLFK